MLVKDKLHIVVSLRLQWEQGYNGKKKTFPPPSILPHLSYVQTDKDCYITVAMAAAPEHCSWVYYLAGWL